MFKISFSGNSKVIDLLQVTKFIKAGRDSKTHSKGDYVCYKFERVPPSPQAKPNKRCIVLYKWMEKKKAFLL
jgi:hypothetical protein